MNAKNISIGVAITIAVSPICLLIGWLAMSQPLRDFLLVMGIVFGIVIWIAAVLFLSEVTR